MIFEIVERYEVPKSDVVFQVGEMVSLFTNCTYGLCDTDAAISGEAHTAITRNSITTEYPFYSVPTRILKRML